MTDVLSPLKHQPDACVCTPSKSPQHLHHGEETMETDEQCQNSFVDFLPWHDIIFEHILPRLDLQSILSLHAVNSSYKALVEEFQQRVQTFDINEARITPSQFHDVTSQMTSLQAMAVGPCDWLTDDMLIPLVDRNPNLMWISLSQCPRLTNNIVKEIAVRCRQLCGLNLRDNDWLTLEGIRWLVGGCPRIQALDLTRCFSIDDQALACIASGAKSLESLSLSGAARITDRGIAHCSLLPHIKYLNLQYTNVTDNSVRLVAKYMPTITNLDIYGCRKVTLHALIRLLSINPRVQLDVTIRITKNT